MFLYYMDVSNLNLKNVKKYVSKNRWESSKKYFNQKDKLLHIGSEALLNHVLKKNKINNPIYSTNSYGKPYLKNYPKIHFNISHSEKYIFCGVSSQAIGVDIEYNHEIDLKIAETCFHEKEYNYIINSKNKNKAFFDIWTLKESYLKMEGIGLNLDLKSFIINIKKNNIQIVPNKKSEYSDKIKKETKLKLWNIVNYENISHKNKNIMYDECEKYSLSVCSLEKISKLNLINCEEIY